MKSKHKIRKRYSVLAAAFLMLVASLTAVRAQGTKTEAPQANEARILLRVVDKDLHFFKTLRAEDLRILEDGRPQNIVSFRQVTDQSVSLAILIDASISQERTFPAQKLAATSFVDLIIRPGKDSAAVATFTGIFEIQQKLTDDVALLRQAIARAKVVPPPGYVGGGIVVSGPPPTSGAVLAGSTAIWDAIIAACSELPSQSSGQTSYAIILLTDGTDTISKSKMADAVDRANGANVAIYSIGIGDPKRYGVDKDSLRKLSERTGGRAFFPKTTSDLSAIFSEIGEELRTQYVIAYLPSTSAGSRKVKIEIVNPALRAADLQLSYQRISPRK